MQVFRSHDTVPETITSPTLEGLAQEWVAINATAEYHRQVSQMGFTGCTRPGDVLDLIDRSDSATANELLYQLVTHDSYLASRMVLQAVLPRVLNNAIARVQYSGTLEDHLQTLIGDVWTAIADYPAHSTKYVALNLTRRRGFEDDDDRCGPLGDFDPGYHESGPEHELKLLVHSALTEGRVAAHDIELLHEIYIQGYSAIEAAERRHVKADVIRQRCSRTRARLAAVAADAADV